jgi:hypothetical protein
MDTLTGQHLGLPVQRQVPGELRHRDVRQQSGRGQAAIDRTWRRGRLHNRGLAGAAAIFRPADAFDPNDRRHDVQYLTDACADPMQFALVARANVTLVLDDDILARQMIWQAANIARGPQARGFRPVRFSVSHRVPFGFDRKS